MLGKLKSRDAAHWRAETARMEARLSEVGERLATVRRERADLMADAETGDELAAKRAEALAADDRKLAEEHERVDLALRGCRQRLAAAEDAEAASDTEAERKRFDRLMNARARDVEEMTRLAQQVAEVQGRLNGSWAEVKALLPHSLGGNDLYSSRGGASFLTRLAMCKAGMWALFGVGKTTAHGWQTAPEYEAEAQAAARLHSGWPQEPE